MANRHWVTAGIMGAMAIALGAFGAHVLKPKLALIPEASGWWNTATLYLLVHALAVGAINPKSSPSLCFYPKWFWFFGSVIFSSTLYAMSLGAPRWLGAITPLGGLLMILGWLSLVWAAREEKS
jgi:uncharacterized membrane protein YgdD (TMEM256/DUF423 family)